MGFMRGSKQYALGNYDKALGEYSQLAGMVDLSSMQGARYLILALTAEAYSMAALGRFEEAIGKTREYMREAEKAGLSDELAKGYLCLSDYYRKLGDVSGSSQYLLDYYTKKDSILSAREITGICNMPLMTQIDQLSVQYQQEKETKQKLSKILWIAIPIVCLLVLFIIFLSAVRRREKKYTKEIYKKNVELLKEEESKSKEIQILEEELSGLKEKLLKEEPGAVVPAESTSLPDDPAKIGDENRGGSEVPGASSDQNEKYQGSQMSQEMEADILQKVHDALDDTELICNTGFTLLQLAERIGYSYKQVSQVINDKTGNNFKTMLNERRIKEACRRLIDQDQYGGFTIEHIARGVGFQSRSHFSISFKAIVGISPSDFQKNARLSAQERKD